jgi:hypothetical protein
MVQMQTLIAKSSPILMSRWKIILINFIFVVTLDFFNLVFPKNVKNRTIPYNDAITNEETIKCLSPIFNFWDTLILLMSSSYPE